MQPTIARSRSRRPLATTALVAWIACIVSGFAMMHRYSLAAGRPAPRSSPAPATGRWRLQMLLHPQCACSRASIEELRALHAHAAGRLDVEVFVVDPDGHPLSVGPLLDELRTLPDVRITRDRGARRARAVGAWTSGQVFLFDPAGKNVFHGGITPARGEIGANTGVAAILQLIEGRGSDQAPATPVFGCPLFRQAT